MLASRKFIEDPFFPVGIREYRPGDPMRSINFKASARSFHGGRAQLMCNDYDSSRTVDSMIFLDLNVYPGAEADDKTLLETGLAYACYLFCRGAENEGKVGFCANASTGDSPYIHIPCGRGEEHNLTVLRTMAEMNVYARRDYSMQVLLARFGKETPADMDLYLITTGTDETHFSPLTVCNRATIVTFLYKAFNSPEVSAVENPFEDVPDESWYTAPVLWAKEAGITSGTDATHFSPASLCNRAQMVTFLYSAYNK
jgi:hypothetical protein